MKEENKKEKGSPNYTLYCVFFPEKIFSFFHGTANLVKSMDFRQFFIIRFLEKDFLKHRDFHGVRQDLRAAEISCP
mgnify:CR=1 FL=1